MARNARLGLTTETIETKVAEAPVEAVESSPEAEAKAAPAPAPAKAAAPVLPPEEIPPAKKYRVTRDHWVILDGQRFMLKAAKIVDEMNYNIQLLKDQGTPLEQL